MNVSDQDYSSLYENLRNVFFSLEMIVKLSIGAFSDIHQKTSIFVEHINGTCTSVLSWLHRRCPKKE